MNAKYFTENLVGFCNSCSTSDPLMRSWEKAANPAAREQGQQITAAAPSTSGWQPS